MAFAVLPVLNILNMAAKFKAIGAGNKGFVLAYSVWLAAPLPTDAESVLKSFSETRRKSREHTGFDLVVGNCAISY